MLARKTHLTRRSKANYPSTMKANTHYAIALGTVILLASSGTSQAQDSDEVITPSQPSNGLSQWANDKLPEFLTSGKVNVNANLRYEYADIDSFGLGPDPRVSNAATIRTRLGYVTGDLAGFKAMVEFEDVTSLNSDDNYNPAGLNPASANRSVIADPEATEVNRAWLSYHRWDTTMKFGRQRIVLDNARFIGNVIWRQNEQTFDAISISNTSLLPQTDLYYAYLFQIHRIVGDDHPAGNWDSDTHLIHISHDLGKYGKMTPYTYLVDLSEAPAVSSATYGASYDGKVPLSEDWAASYKAEFAIQTDYGDNPISYTAPYYHLNSGGHYQKANFGVGYEVLGSDDGNAAVSTPLATAHAFNGWADAWLNTPADGLEDLYVWVGYELPWQIPAKILYHTFSSAKGSQDYGNEINAIATKKIGKYFNLLAKFAYYQGGDNGRADRTRFWLQGSFNF